MSELAWWQPRADAARLSLVARLIQAEARAARTGDPVGELQRMLTMFRMPVGTLEHDDAVYQLAGFALAALTIASRTLQHARRLQGISEGQFLAVISRVADTTHGPIVFVPVRRRAQVGRLDREAHPAIAGHLVTTMALVSAVRTAFVQQVLAEMEVEPARCWTT